MNTTEFTNTFAAAYEISQTQAKNMVGAFIEHLSNCIESNEEVFLSGLGGFKQSYQKPRPMYRIKDGSTAERSPVVSIHFVPSKAVKDELRKRAYKIAEERGEV